LLFEKNTTGITHLKIKLESNWAERNFSVKNNPQLENNYSDAGEKRPQFSIKIVDCELLYLKWNTVKRK